MGQPQVQREVGQPGQQAKVRGHRRRHRSCRCVGRRLARGARLQREGLHLPRLPPSCPLDRCSGRHQRGEELPQRRRLGLSPLLRHREGGDYRAREANVHRLAQVSVDIIDQCAAQGVPFAREYGGLLANRSFGGAQVSRTFYARGQTGQQLLLGAYQALAGAIQSGKVTLYNRSDVLDIVTKDGEAKGIVVRDMLTGRCTPLGAMPSCSPPAVTATCTTSPPTRWPPTSPQRGGPIARAPCSPTPATPRSTRPASRPPTSSSPS